VHRVEEIAEEALEHALKFNITFYDVAYAALAVKLHHSLYTFDKGFASKLREASLPADIVITGCPTKA
jgi:predicted nucleic acid-binding protein